MAEWPKAHDWKSCIPLKGIEGSNPSLSANNRKSPPIGGLFLLLVRVRDLNPKRGFDQDERRTEVRRWGEKPNEDAAAKR